MNWSRLLSLSVFSVAAFAFAAAPDGDAPPLEFKRLDLLNKRTLRDVVVRSYDAKTDRFLVIAGGKATTIPASLVPAPFADQLRQNAPASGGTVSSGTDPIPPPRIVTSSNTTPPATAPAPNASATAAAAHRAAAIDRALTFYRYEFVAGSAAMRVDSVKIDAEPARAVPGWSGRYRTLGKAYLELFDTKGWSATRAQSSFEIITEQKPDEPIVVIDFSRKS